jgi:starch synthase
MVTAEAAPFVKSGGLGDVLGSLPKALRHMGIDVRVILPDYQTIPAEYQAQMTLLGEITVPVSWRRQYGGIKRLEYAGIAYYFLDNRYYFDRPAMYGFFDEAERYAFFCRGVLEALPRLDFQPGIIHCHDWHTGMVSVLLAAHYRHHSFYRALKTMFTIHNLKYQGIFSKQIMGDILDLDWSYFTIDGVEFYDQVSFLKGGLNFSDCITTVSKTYAAEIQTPFFGENLDGLLRRRQDNLYGIVNGIDPELYDPANDAFVDYSYDHFSDAKVKNKERLQAALGLNTGAQIPVIAIISRLVSQKGLDLVAHVLEEILALDVQLVVLGTGEERYQQLFRQAAERFPAKVSTNLYFDEGLARRIYAGADLLLMPSLYEPCGIAQLIAMRYGTLPLVRETGGLKDTIIPYNEFTGEGNGFSFSNYNAHDMLYTLRRALAIYQDQPCWRRIVDNAMSGDYSWQASAREYANLYRNMLLKEAHHGS